jgi:hypothetical protein
MKDVDRQELNNATIVTYALVMALLDEFDEAAKKRIAARALAHLPPPPNPTDGRPVDEQMWRDARSELKELAGL